MIIVPLIKERDHRAIENQRRSKNGSIGDNGGRNAPRSGHINKTSGNVSASLALTGCGEQVYERKVWHALRCAFLVMPLLRGPSPGQSFPALRSPADTATVSGNAAVLIAVVERTYP
jgi:hypothetical protein